MTWLRILSLCIAIPLGLYIAFLLPTYDQIVAYFRARRNP